jgi:P-type Cu+ transporter
MSEKEQNISVKIKGMTCVNCALNIESSVKKLGLEDVAVNFATRELHVSGLNDLGAKEIKKAVENAGYEIDSETDNSFQQTKDTVLLSISILTAVYFMVQMFAHWHTPFLDLALASIVLAIGWQKFGKGAIHSVLSGSANMYVLILLGASTAYLFSIYLMITQPNAHLYFEAAVVIIALVMLGKKIEDISIQKTTAGITGLANISIQKGKKIVNGEVKTVSINEIRVNDIVSVNTGDYVPTDGIIESGSGTFNEALLTGESEPLFKKIGDLLLGGAVLSEGNITYKVTRPGYESTLAQINKLVQKASNEKAEIQKYADKISAIFVPFIVIFAALWFIINLFVFSNGFEIALIRSVTILVVSCPCAMGLATPIAVMVGLGKLSEKGILIKTAKSIENYAKITRIILDKTGTLTTGKFRLQDFTTFGGEENLNLSIIKTIENKSSHPIAHSITAQLKDTPFVELESVEEIKGSGMKAIDAEGNEYKLGNAVFTEIQNHDFDIYLVKNGKLQAAFNIQDEIKTGVEESIDYFKKRGITPIVLSGDSPKKCHALSETLGIEAIASLKPEDKLAKIETYSNEVLAMVGDGVNDAPALSKVNVGISFGKASQLAIESSDVILMRDSFSLLETSHKISVQTVKTIKQNLFWAFSYNIVAIPLAAFGIFKPMMAAFLMLFSSLVVVGNSYLLKMKKIES